MDKKYKPNILVIDDAENWRNTFSDVLVDELHIVSSSSYEDTVIILESAQILFAVAIIDIRLDPLNEANIDGLHLAKLIKRESPDTSIVVVTGHPSLETMHEAFKEIDVLDYAQKVPSGKLFDVSGFRKTIRSAVEQFQWKQKYSPDEMPTKRVEQLTEMQSEIADNEQAMVVKFLAEDIIHSMNNAIGKIPSRVSQIQNLVDNDEWRKDDIQHELDKILKDVQSSYAQATSLVSPNFEWEDVDIAELINIVFGDLEPYTPPEISFSIAIKNVVDQDSLVVHGIRSQLMTAFKNLVNNSVSFIDKEGEIHVEIARISDEDSGSVQIIISDTGPGVSFSEADRIFDLGSSTKEYGLGYGLWRSKSIIEKHGGSIELVPSTSDGTIFTIRLPQA